MPQYTIDIGAVANDGTGDPLRTAFNEVNLNFDQVFTAGPVLSNVRIANNTILTTTTNGNLILAPNGIGVVQSNVHIVPNTANIRNLGAADRRWSSLYVQYANISGNLDLAGTFSVGDLTVSGNLTVTGNTIQIGNLITDAKTIQLANTASTANAATGSGMTVGANDAIATFLFSSSANAWTTNLGLNVTGNIIPAANVTYSLGNSTNWWSNVWVANNTIYIGGVALGMTAGNVLTVGGNAVLQNGSDSTISTTGNITAGNVLTGGVVSAAGNVRGANFNTVGLISATGNITGNYFVGNGSQLTGIVSSYGNANVANYLPTFSGNISAGNVSASGNVTANYFVGLSGSITNLDSLNFTVENISALVGNNGVNIGAGGYNNLVVLPTDVLIQNVPLTVDTLIVNQIRSNDSSFVTIEDGLNINGDITADTVTTTGNITGNYFIGNGSQLTGLNTNSISNGNSSVSIATANGNPTVTSAGDTWTFGGPQPDALYWPDGSFQATAFVGQALDLVNTGNASITSNSTGNTTYVWTFGDDGRLTFPGTPRIATDSDNFEVQAAESINFEANAVVNIYTDTSGTTYQWQFGDTGNLSAPGAISAVGNVTSGNILTGGLISAAGNVTGANIITTGNISGNTAGFAIGYLNIPQVSLAANATIAATDPGKHYYSTSASNLTLTIANNTSVSWAVGTAITVVNRGSGNITVAQGTGVSLYLAGNSSAANRTVSTYGMATLINLEANVWMINGTGLT